MKTFCGGSGGGAAPSQTKESVPNEGRGPGRQVFGAGGPRAPAMAGRRPPIDPCTRSARRAPPTHSPRPRAAQPVQSALPVPACRLFQLVAGLPSLASWGWVRVFLAAAAATSYAAGLNILSTSTRSTTADAFEHAGKHARAYAREPCELGSIPRRVEPDKLLSLLFDDSLRGMRCAALCTLLRCLAHAHDYMLSPHCANVWQAVAVDLSLATESRGRGR